MGWFKTKESPPAVPATQTAPRPGWQVGWEWNRYMPLMGGEQRLYGTLRESVPTVSAALEKTVRLIGAFQVEYLGTATLQGLTEFLRHALVGVAQVGIQGFLYTYFDQLLICGAVVGETLLNADACGITGLYDARLEHPELCRGGNPLGIQLYVRGQSGRAVPVKHPNLTLVSALSPESGEMRGVSILRGFPFLEEVLMKVHHTISTNWDRVGNTHFVVTYKPSSEGNRAYGVERVRQITGQWSRATQSRAGVSNSATVGDVSIRVTGADNQILDSEIPVRQLLEQIMAKLNVPPFLLGPPWLLTERMSSQQTGLLTSELESYRRLPEPMIEKICQMWLLLNGYSKQMEIIWEDISLQDAVGLAGAGVRNVRTTKLEREIQKEKGGRAWERAV